MAHDKPTDDQIKAAIARHLAKHPTKDRIGVDQVRVCYEWLDAQNKTAKIVSGQRGIKSMIGKWAACSITWQEVMVAADLHPRIRGSNYPNLNISKLLILPKLERLDGIPCAGAHGEPGVRVNMFEYERGREGEPKRVRRAKRRWIGSQLVTDR